MLRKVLFKESIRKDSHFSNLNMNVQFFICSLNVTQRHHGTFWQIFFSFLPQFAQTLRIRNTHFLQASDSNVLASVLTFSFHLPVPHFAPDRAGL